LVILFGYRFNDKTQFVTELEVEHVEEIYVVGKVLVPVLSLKPKPKRERDQLMKARKVEKPIADHPAVNKVSELRRKSK